MRRKNTFKIAQKNIQNCQIAIFSYSWACEEDCFSSLPKKRVAITEL